MTVNLQTMKANARAVAAMAFWRAMQRAVMPSFFEEGNGVVLYEGPSAINGDPIVVIATAVKKATDNRKTGDMIQVWILPTGVKPHEAIKTGADYSVCGDCKHRKKTCYVLVHNAPRAVYEAYMNGRYPHIGIPQAVALFEGASVRFGAWGDPAAIPQHIGEPLMKAPKVRTGYSHQWHKAFAAWLAPYVMASVDNLDEYATATSQGWRTFRVKRANAAIAPGEIVCLADAQDRTCAACGLCNGAGRGKNIVIDVHGQKKARF